MPKKIKLECSQYRLSLLHQIPYHWFIRLIESASVLPLSSEWIISTASCNSSGQLKHHWHQDQQKWYEFESVNSLLPSDIVLRIQQNNLMTIDWYWLSAHVNDKRFRTKNLCLSHSVNYRLPFPVWIGINGHDFKAVAVTRFMHSLKNAKVIVSNWPTRHL